MTIQTDVETNSSSNNSGDLASSGTSQFYITILSSIKEPLVCDIEARSVLVRLTPIDLDSFLNGKSIEPSSSSSTTTIIAAAVESTNTETNNSLDLIKLFESLNYTLELSSNETNLFNKVYTGDANEITLKDLRPSTKYYLRVFASLSTTSRNGKYTNAVCFQTLACAPDRPAAPKSTGTKKKNELTVKWTAPTDNGAKIASYTLEYKQIDDVQITEDPNNNNNNSNNKSSINTHAHHTTTISTNEYVPLYKGPLKQFIVKKLRPSQCYAFRVQAENSWGGSEFSPPCFVYTLGQVPRVPDPPRLLEATATSLTLVWASATSTNTGEQEDSYYYYDYELQFLDSSCQLTPMQPHSFLTVYNGSALSYRLTELRRHTAYDFRLRARNEAGASGWSESRCFATLAARPQSPPARLRVNKTTQASFKAAWEACRDDGGDPICFYTLYLVLVNDTTNTNGNSGNNGNKLSPIQQQHIEEAIYEGQSLEHVIYTRPLLPGRSYAVKVACSNRVGESQWSEPAMFVTPAVVPGKCGPPKLHAKPKQHTAQLKCQPPEQDGGAVIQNYEIGVIEALAVIPAIPAIPTTGVDNTNNTAISTIINSEETVVKVNVSDLVCSVGGLAPGRRYLARVRVQNKCGWSEWSDRMEFVSAAAVPDQPQAPSVLAKSASFLLITWSEPCANGSPILEYRLEWSAAGKANEFTQLYSGTQLKYELKGNLIQPNTAYLFRVLAQNSNGPSPFSACSECISPASVPATIHQLQLDEITCSAVRLRWKEPAANGQPITHYNLEFSELSSSSSVHTSSSSQVTTIIPASLPSEPNEYRIDQLQPDQQYKLRLQAANSCGPGAFSTTLKFKTKSLPPPPPQIQLVSASYSHVKLRWDSQPSENSNNNNNNSNAVISNAAVNTLVFTLEMTTLAQLKAIESKSIANDDDNEANEDDQEEEEDQVEFVCVYKGPLTSIKVHKLQESTAYAFRISAANESSQQGAWSAPLFTCQTTKAPPLIHKAPLVSELTNSSCLVEWLPPSGYQAMVSQPIITEPTMEQTVQEDKVTTTSTTTTSTTNTITVESIEYCLQMSSKRETEYREIYRGTDASFRLHNLEPNTEYQLRVCASLLRGGMPTPTAAPYSPPATFLTLKQQKLLSQNSTASSAINHHHHDHSTVTAKSTKALANSSRNKVKFFSADFFKRLMWPSFYADLSAREKRTRFSSQLTTSSTSFVGKPVKPVANKQRLASATSSVSGSVQANTLEQPIKSSSHVAGHSDKLWALLVIAIFLAICFLLAFVVDYVYTNTDAEMPTATTTTTTSSPTLTASGSHNSEL